VVGEEDGKIAGMVAVGLTVWVPVPARGLKRIGGVADFTAAKLVNMKSVGTDGAVFTQGRLIRREPRDTGGDPSAAGSFIKIDLAPQIGSQRTALYHGHSNGEMGVLYGIPHGRSSPSIDGVSYVGLREKEN
jgi:hypothetical protein